jgi:signal transduction histidine kinase
MKNYKDLLIISTVFLILSMIIVYVSPRFDIITLFLFILLSILLFVLMKRVRDLKENLLNKKIDEMITLLHTIDKEAERLELEDDIFGNLKDEIIKSIVEKREIALQAMESKHTLKTYMEDITHQVKTPLTGILLMLDLIEEDPDNTDKYVKIIRNDIYRLYDLTDILLKMSSLDAGIMPMKKEIFSVKELIIDAEMSLESYFSKDELKIDTIGNDFNLERDRQWILEALINLIKNGMEVSKGEGVQIELRETTIFKSILVRDYSEGISKKELSKVFERFYKSNPKSKGFGIGLSMVKAIMDKQNGELLYFREKKSNYFELRFYR